mmetsp:Transcript_61586/g.181996  ORF Transcript_61586/g.181996 Transcript_61586/m.181996 type:complete len:225 (-) Transcript_61586:866-1540(-)
MSVPYIEKATADSLQSPYDSDRRIIRQTNSSRSSLLSAAVTFAMTLRNFMALSFSEFSIASRDNSSSSVFMLSNFWVNNSSSLAEEFDRSEGNSSPRSPKTWMPVLMASFAEPSAIIACTSVEYPGNCSCTVLAFKKTWSRCLFMVLKSPMMYSISARKVYKSRHKALWHCQSSSERRFIPALRNARADENDDITFDFCPANRLSLARSTLSLGSVMSEAPRCS